MLKHFENVIVQKIMQSFKICVQCKCNVGVLIYGKMFDHVKKTVQYLVYTNNDSNSYSQSQKSGYDDNPKTNQTLRLP